MESDINKAKFVGFDLVPGGEALGDIHMADEAGEVLGEESVEDATLRIMEEQNVSYPVARNVAEAGRRLKDRIRNRDAHSDDRGV